MSSGPGDQHLDTTLHIDCQQCSRQGTDTCHDCVVTYLCDHEPGSAVVIQVAEVRALRLLGDAGLAPNLLHHRRAG